MYKDKDKQREANRKAKQRQRERIEQGMTITLDNVIPDVIPKRGKDIKCFEDLPLDVQQTIRSLSDTNEEFQKRTQTAIRYQHLFPDRYHSTGLSRTSTIPDKSMLKTEAGGRDKGAGGCL